MAVPKPTTQNHSGLPSLPVRITGLPIYFQFVLSFPSQGGNLAHGCEGFFPLESTFCLPSFPLFLQLKFMDFDCLYLHII